MIRKRDAVINAPHPSPPPPAPPRLSPQPPSKRSKLDDGEVRKYAICGMLSDDVVCRSMGMIRKIGSKYDSECSEFTYQRPGTLHFTLYKLAMTERSMRGVTRSSDRETVIRLGAIKWKWRSGVYLGVEDETPFNELCDTIRGVPKQIKMKKQPPHLSLYRRRGYDKKRFDEMVSGIHDEMRCVSGERGGGRVVVDRILIKEIGMEWSSATEVKYKAEKV